MFKRVADYSAVYELLEKEDDDKAKADAIRMIAENHYEMLEWFEISVFFSLVLIL